ncbi:MAG: hypothetical protein EAZ35_08450 [Sphingobacteriia bacterium]|nr:MAG: hypothetical protein EAZ41_09525 [Sphingobacteriia bacterium]TAG30102.1 MAG: hypothetical protein EAZ35_08450 [Sphingobacteriia bacterium]
MELDDFKNRLNQKLETNHLHLSERDLSVLLSKKAYSVIGKIKRSLWIEIISCILIAGIFAYIGISSKYRAVNIYFISFTIIFIPFTLVFVYLLKKTNEVNQSNLPIINNLQSLVKLLDEFIKRYFQFTMALIPICFVFSFILGYTEKKPIIELDQLIYKYKPSSGIAVSILIAYFGGLTFCTYYFTKWYLKKLYGNYIIELKNYITELKDAA